MFDEGRFWTVEVTYAKVSPGEILCQVDVVNNGPDESDPPCPATLSFRNTWRWAAMPRCRPCAVTDAMEVEHRGWGYA